MTKFHAITVLGLLAACLAGNLHAQEAAVTPACSPFQPLAILYSPPIDGILAALKGLRPSADDTLGEGRGDYRQSAAVLISTSSTSSVPRIGLEKSSGNRDIDRAIIAWAHGVQFVPGSCGKALIPVQLHPGNEP